MTKRSIARGRITFDELKDAIGDGSIDTVVVAIPDMQGRLMGKRVTGDFFLEHAHHGTHFCTYLLGTDMEMRTPEGFALTNWESGYGDWLADPDWSTARRIPWLEKTVLVLADTLVESTREQVAVAPRTILRRQIQRATELAFTPLTASELEFYLLRGTFEDLADGGHHVVAPYGSYNEDYNLLQGTKVEPLYRQFRNQLSEAGVPIEFSKGEAAAGQHEVNIHFDRALESADRHALFKHGVKEIAYQNGYAVTFMAKPHHNWTGSSAHVHLSLWDSVGKRNVFFEEGAEPYGMSTVCRHFLGGLMHCIRELCFFIAPYVNSYKRFASLSWAPVNIVWGRDNRTCGFRVVGSGSSLRIEIRFPGGDTNPYLCHAAVLGAGLYGVRNEIEPPAEWIGNGYLATGVDRIPRSLYQAIELLEESAVAREIFGEEVVAHYLNSARVEQEAYDQVVTCWERQRYLERG